MKQAFPHVFRYFENCWGRKSRKKIPEEGFYLLLKKGFFPYEYFNDFKRFQEKKLPPKEAFYNELKDEDIDDESYQHALKVYDLFRLSSFKEYHDLYLELDTVDMNH